MRKQIAIHKVDNSVDTWFDKCEDYFIKSWFYYAKVEIPKIKQRINDQRSALIAEALSTPEGRVALASAMIQPILRSSQYNSVGRKLLMVDEIPTGACFES